MPTYTDQGGQIYTAPGLVPSFYGVVIGLLSLWLAGARIRAGALSAAGKGEPRETGNSNARFVLAAGLGLIFIVGLIGRMPFWLAATDLRDGLRCGLRMAARARSTARARRFAVALAIGLCTGILVTLVFERVFLVRLP